MNLIEACKAAEQIQEAKMKLIEVVNEVTGDINNEQLLKITTAAWGAGFTTYHNMLHRAITNGDIFIQTKDCWFRAD